MDAVKKLDLALILRAAGKYQDWAEQLRPSLPLGMLDLIVQDIPALCTEIERLREELRCFRLYDDERQGKTVEEIPA